MTQTSEYRFELLMDVGFVEPGDRLATKTSWIEKLDGYYEVGHINDDGTFPLSWIYPSLQLKHGAKNFVIGSKYTVSELAHVFKILPNGEDYVPTQEGDRDTDI